MRSARIFTASLPHPKYFGPMSTCTFPAFMASSAGPRVPKPANRVRAGKGGEEEERCLRAASAHEDAAVREIAAWGLSALESAADRAKG